MNRELDSLYDRHEELINILTDASFELDNIEQEIEEMKERQQSEQLVESTETI